MGDTPSISGGVSMSDVSMSAASLCIKGKWGKGAFAASRISADPLVDGSAEAWWTARTRRSEAPIVAIDARLAILLAADALTRPQVREALAVLSGRPEGAASKAAIELAVDEARRCPHCAAEGAVSRGMARGLRRYQSRAAAGPSTR